MIQRRLDNMTTPIGKRIARARALTDGLTAADWGSKAGLSRAIVSLIESGKREVPNVQTVSKLAAVLGLDLGWLIDGAGEKPTRESVRAALEAHEARVSRRKGAA